MLHHFSLVINAERIVSELQDVTTEPQSKRARSNIWSYFKKAVSENGESIARCKSSSVLYINQKGASNLSKHYKKFHERSSYSQTTLTNDGRFVQTLPLNTDAAEKITQQLVAAVVDAVLPFSIVENEEFIQFAKLLQPRYVSPSRQTIQRRVLNEYANFKDKPRNQICAKIESKISITVDG